MAGDWIKLECTTPDKPEIVRMASKLRIDQDAVVGKLLRVWVWADQNSVSGEKVTITAAFIDRLTNRKGFASAMRSAGWLIGDDDSMTFPNFGRHNGTTAKSRSVTNRRVAEHRKCNGVSVTKDEQKPLPEKRERREETDQPEEPTAASPKPSPKRAASDTDAEWIAGLLAMDCYRPVDVRRELGKAQAWAATNHRQCTRKFFINWLNRSLTDQRAVKAPAPIHTPGDESL